MSRYLTSFSLFKNTFEYLVLFWTVSPGRQRIKRQSTILSLRWTPFNVVFIVPEMHSLCDAICLLPAISDHTFVWEESCSLDCGVPWQFSHRSPHSSVCLKDLDHPEIRLRNQRRNFFTNFHDSRYRYSDILITKWELRVVPKAKFDSLLWDLIFCSNNFRYTCASSNSDTASYTPVFKHTLLQISKFLCPKERLRIIMFEKKAEWRSNFD